MKTNMTTYGKSPNGLTDNEVMDLFNVEFGERAATDYFEFIWWLFANKDNCNPWDDPDLFRRDKVREFVETRLAGREGSVC